jgi:hypothetical protein
LFERIENFLPYLNVFGSFATSATALTRGLGDKPVLQTRSPKGTVTELRISRSDRLLNARTFSELFHDHLTLEAFVNFRAIAKSKSGYTFSTRST